MDGKENDRSRTSTVGTEMREFSAMADIPVRPALRNNRRIWYGFLAVLKLESGFQGENRLIRKKMSFANEG
jgi:hypothetical protein